MYVYTPKVPKTEDVGFANNDIDGYLKNLLESVTRECAQNSNDEACDRPVHMSIDRMVVPAGDIPGIERYKEVIEGCLKEARTREAGKAIEFFENAKRELGKDSIELLLISDSRTNGAGGQFRKGGKFFTLTVSEGVTDKQNFYSAGSFGIGKNAAIAGSSLRLVFYSSRYGENGETGFYCIGKSVLTSWSENDENKTHRIFFSADREELCPVNDQDVLPDWAKKEDQGLKVTIVAPRIELKEGWVAGYIANLLSNFFVAIHDGDIEFYLDNRKVVINQSTMQSYFPRDDVKKAAEDAGMLEQLSWAETCSNALAAGEFKSETVEVPGLGDFEVLIQVGEEMPSKVFFVRNGMYITDTLKHFGKPLKRFPNTKAFAVIVRPKSVDDASSANIKRMENPEHNELTTGYIASPEEVSKLQEAVQHLESEVREVINKYAQMEVLDSREIEELAEFFPAPGEDEYVVYQKDGDPTSVISERVPRKRARIGYRNDGEKGGKGKRGKGSSRSKGGKGPGGDKGGNNKQIHLSCRAMKVSESSWRIRIEEVGGSGTIEFWPQARSRGTETKSLKIESCNLNNANIAADGLSMRVPVSGEKPVELELALNDDDSVVDFRPVLSEK